MQRLKGPKLTESIPCGYCFQKWATCYDHIKPVAHEGRNNKENLYPACQRCNSILSSKLFDTLDAKRNYIREELQERGEWLSGTKMQVLRERFSTQKEMANILRVHMPFPGMGPRTSPKNINSSRYGFRCPGESIWAWQLRLERFYERDSYSGLWKRKV